MASPGKKWLSLFFPTARPSGDEAESLGHRHTGPDAQGLGMPVDGLDRAQQYLQGHNIHAHFVERKGNPGQEILQTAQEKNCNLIVMGSYGYRAVLEIAMGSAVDQIFRSFGGSVMVCR